MLSPALEPARVRRSLLAWYDRQGRSLPWRERWARDRDPYTVWVSEIMLQQTVIKAVLSAYERFLIRFPDIASLAAADEDSVRQACKGLGYYRRFRFLHSAARQLVAGGSIWPRNFEEWRALPGIGIYTAGAIASIALDEAVSAVDGNVERVFCRLLDMRLAPDAKELKPRFRVLATSLVAPDRPGDFNQALMELGQTVCRKEDPHCGECPLSDLCLSRARGSQSLAPQPKAKNVTAVPTRLRVAIPIHPDGRIGLVQRGEGARFLRDTWGFPMLLKIADAAERPNCASEPNLIRRGQSLAGTFRHSITKHRIDGEVYVVVGVTENLKWVGAAAVETILTSSLDQKAWRNRGGSAPTPPAGDESSAPR